MARLSNQAKIKRLRSQGYSRADIARVTGSSVSAVGRAERGQTKGDSFSAPLSEFFKLRKKAKASAVKGEISLPSAKPARPSKSKSVVEKIVEIVSPLRRAEGKASELDGDSMVVVQVTLKGTGKSKTLFARGGIWIGQIKYDLKGAISKQYGIQYNGDPLNWDDVIDIDVQEY